MSDMPRETLTANREPLTGGAAHRENSDLRFQISDLTGGEAEKGEKNI